MKKIERIYTHSDISGLIPGVKGQRAFPTIQFKNSDPYLMLDHIGPQKVGTDWYLDGTGHDHPHRGFETLTFMFEGMLEHRDSLGNRTKLSSGSVQRMNAGSGIIHGGDMASDKRTERFHEMQLWINNPQKHKLSSPEVHNVSTEDIPEVEQNGVKLRVFSGRLNHIKGPIHTMATTQIGHVMSDQSGEIIIESFSEQTKVMIYVLEGELTVDCNLLNSYELAHLTEEGQKVKIQIGERSQALVLAGIPLNEPVAFGGPFVMNTQEEIDQANIDFQKGKFGSIAI